MNLRVRPRVNIKQYEFFAFEVGRFFGGTFFNEIMITISSLTT